MDDRIEKQEEERSAFIGEARRSLTIRHWRNTGTAKVQAVRDELASGIAPRRVLVAPRSRRLVTLMEGLDPKRREDVAWMNRGELRASGLVRRHVNRLRQRRALRKRGEKR